MHPGVFIDMAQTETGAAIMAPLYLDFSPTAGNGDAAPNEVPGALLSVSSGAPDLTHGWRLNSKTQMIGRRCATSRPA